MHLYTEKIFTHLNSPRLNIHARLVPMGDFYQSMKKDTINFRGVTCDGVTFAHFQTPLSSTLTALSFLYPWTSHT